MVALPYGTVTTVVDLTTEAPMVFVKISVYVDVPLSAGDEVGDTDGVVDLEVLLLVVVELKPI